MAGVGTWESADGLSRYQGGWLKDAKHGLGRQVYGSGDVYEGCVRDADGSAGAEPCGGPDAAAGVGAGAQAQPGPRHAPNRARPQRSAPHGFSATGGGRGAPATCLACAAYPT